MATIEHTRAVRGGPPSLWRSEPFRIFFPLGVLFAWVGVGHWLAYTTGVTATYSCKLHGAVQMQAFMMAFASGFLLTALPRRTQSGHVTRIEMGAIIAALVLTTLGALDEQWIVSEAAYAALFVILGRFAIRRFTRRAAGRRPPAAFVLVPIAAFTGIVGAILIAVSELSGAPQWSSGLGRLMVEQGVFLCLTVGVGGLIIPLVGGVPPPADLGSSARETRKAIAYAAAGVAIIASLVIEQLGFNRAGPLIRAVVVAIGIGIGAGALSAPIKTGAHRRLLWLSAWLMPTGLAASALWPDYRVPALHILFIGGFALMAFSVATHVMLGHLNMERQAMGRPPIVIVLGAAFIIAMLLRLTADASNTYFVHLGWASAVWIFGSAVWLVFFLPKLLRPTPP